MPEHTSGVQGRGTIALPADGVMELRAALPVPADQRWFWAQRWQEREREVDEHVAAGQVTGHESTEDFLDHLDTLPAE